MAKGKNNTPITKKVKTDMAVDRSPLKPMNPRQKQYINAINTSGVVICIGVLGSSKTYIPAVMAADQLLAGTIQHVVIARPAEGAGKSVGFFKGDKDEKLSGWCEPVTGTLRKRLGPTAYLAMLDSGKIELLALEQCKGRNFDYTFLIVDEAEDLDVAVAKSIVTRAGVGSTVVIAGDIAQQDIKTYSGLQYLLDANRYRRKPAPVIEFDLWEHCVRGEDAKDWGMAFETMDRRSEE
jgi:phosphate starvation-inducible PhoH-like protein